MTNTGAFFAVVFCYVSTLHGTVECQPCDRLPADANPGDIDRLLKAGAIRFQAADDGPTPPAPEITSPDLEQPAKAPAKKAAAKKATTRRRTKKPDPAPAE